MKTYDNVIDVNIKGSDPKQEDDLQNKKYSLMKMGYLQNRIRDPNAPSLSLIDKIRTSLDSDASTGYGMYTLKTFDSESIERLNTEINHKINYAVKNSSNDLRLKKKAVENTISSLTVFVSNVQQYLREQNNIYLDKEKPPQFECQFQKVTNFNQTAINQMYKNKQELERKMAEEKARKKPDIVEISTIELVDKENVLLRITDNIEFIKSQKFLDNDEGRDNVVNRFKEGDFFGMTDMDEPIVEKVEPEIDLDDPNLYMDNLDWDDKPTILNSKLIRKFEKKKYVDANVRKELLSTTTDLNKTFDNLDRRYKVNKHWSNISHYYRHSGKKEWEEQDYGEIITTTDWHQNNKKFQRRPAHNSYSPRNHRKQFIKPNEKKASYDIKKGKPINQDEEMLLNLQKSY